MIWDSLLFSWWVDLKVYQLYYFSQEPGFAFINFSLIIYYQNMISNSYIYYFCPLYFEVNLFFLILAFIAIYISFFFSKYWRVYISL